MKNGSEFDYKCEVLITDTPFCKNENTTVYGFPYKNENIFFSKEWKSLLSNIKGYFSFVKYEEDKIYIGTDYSANYRLYYYQGINNIYISNDYSILISKIKEFSSLTLNKKQLEIWEKHRYTFGEDTLFDEIKKIPPSSYLVVDKGKLVNVNNYFEDIIPHPHYKKLLSTLKADILDSISEVVNKYSYIDNKYLLFYSGGTDSTLLAYIMQELKIPYTAVILKFKPFWSMNYNDYLKAIENAKKIGIKNIEIIEINLETAKLNIDLILQDMLFDRHLSVAFYESYRVITEKFGNNIITISGQGADSILSYGPSEFSLGDFMRRSILYYPKLSKPLFNKLVQKKLGKQYEIPINNQNINRAFLDEKGYFFVRDKNCNYIDVLDYYSKKAASIIKGEASLRMFFKQNYLQGPDNQVIIKSANSNGINRIVMPFVTPQFIKSCIKYKQDWRDLFFPKYFVRDILKKDYKYNSYYNQIKKGRKLSDNIIDFDMKSYEEEINSKFRLKLKEVIE